MELKHIKRKAYETAQFLINLKQKLEKDLDKFFKKAMEVKLATANTLLLLKKCKKANMTPSVWFINQLIDDRK